MLDITDKEDAVLNHISEAVKTARGTLFIVVGACFYCLLTISATTDEALFFNNTDTVLPIVSTRVNIISFYSFAPIVLIAFQTYFLAYSQKIWLALSKLPQTHCDEESWLKSFDIEQLVHPWLMMDFAREYNLKMYRPEHMLGSTYSKISALSAWTLVPLTLVALMLKGMASGYLWLPFLISTCIAVSIWIALFFWMLARRTLSRACITQDTGLLDDWSCETRSEPSTVVMDHSALQPFNLSSLVRGGIILCSSWALLWLFYQNPNGRICCVGANLIDANFSEKLEDWYTADIANFNSEVSSIDIGVVDCNPEERARQSFDESYEGRRLRSALLSDVFAIGVDFDNTDFSRARIEKGEFQKSSFNGARFFRIFTRLSDFRCARFYDANLTYARFEGALLDDASFRGANLRYARFIGGSFVGTNFAGADLTGVKFRPPNKFEEYVLSRPVNKTLIIDLRAAIFGRSVKVVPSGGILFQPYTNVSGADLRNVILDKSQETSMCGDQRTQYPRGFSAPMCPEEMRPQS